MVGTNMDSITEEWQGIIDLMARIINVPAGLIMRLNDGNLEVFTSSNTVNNPYSVGDNEIMDNSGLYCESVIKTNNVLKVPNALKDIHWENNPDVKLNMISYLGYPIHYPDGSIFGTICVLDNKENHYNKDYEELVEQFRNFTEGILELLEQNNELEYLSQIDPLTKMLNRRTLFKRVEEEIARTKRYDRSLSFILLDIDFFKKVNDSFGHQAGDFVLEQISEKLKDVLRPHDVLGRYGGEEFFICLPETNYSSAHNLAKRILKEISELKIKYDSYNLTINMSAGVIEYEKDETLKSIISRVDNLLYKAKDSGRNCVS